MHVNISDFQKRNLKHALEHGEPVSIRLSYNGLCGDDILTSFTYAKEFVYVFVHFLLV